LLDGTRLCRSSMERTLTSKGAVMVTMKGSVCRRVWRMTSDSPFGEYLELMPKEAHAAKVEHPVIPGSPVKPGAAPCLQRAQATPNAGGSTPQEPALYVPATTPAKVRVLRPAQVESWRSSSFDLLSGLQVRDVTDTIPGQVFEELFRTIPATVFTKRRC
jgi:hypothetical protein